MLDKATRLTRGVLTMLALAAAAACGRDAPPKVDDDLARDIALAGQMQSQVQFRDTAITTAPVPVAPERERDPAPAPAPERRRASAVRPRPEARTPERRPVVPVLEHAPAAAPARGEVVSAIGAGSSLALTSGSRICTETNRPGDKFVGTVTETVYGSNGAEIPAGSKVVLEVASATAGDTPESSQLEFRVRSIAIGERDFPASGTAVAVSPLERTKIEKADPGSDRKKVIGGAIAGAILGQIMGRNTKSTVIGAAAGAATGAVVAKAGEKHQTCLPEGSSVRVTLSNDVVMSRR